MWGAFCLAPSHFLYWINVFIRDLSVASSRHAPKLVQTEKRHFLEAHRYFHSPRGQDMEAAPGCARTRHQGLSSQVQPLYRTSHALLTYTCFCPPSPCTLASSKNVAISKCSLCPQSFQIKLSFQDWDEGGNQPSIIGIGTEEDSGKIQKKGMDLRNILEVNIHDTRGTCSKEMKHNYVFFTCLISFFCLNISKFSRLFKISWEK